MSDIGMIKILDGFPVRFIRFEGADRFVVIADGKVRTLTRDDWRSLTIYREDDPHPSNFEGLPKSAD